jgi:hypothetical protein
MNENDSAALAEKAAAGAAPNASGAVIAVWRKVRRCMVSSFLR